MLVLTFRASAVSERRECSQWQIGQWSGLWPATPEPITRGVEVPAKEAPAAPQIGSSSPWTLAIQSVDRRAATATQTISHDVRLVAMVVRGAVRMRRASPTPER